MSNQRYGSVPCVCGMQARIVMTGVGTYVSCPYCKQSTYMCSTREDALKKWEELGKRRKGEINMAENKNGIVYIGTGHIHPHPENPRKDLGDLVELAESLKKNGVMQNLTVVPVEGKPGEYYALIGNRRHGAATLAGIKELPCRVVTDMDRREQLSTMLEENMQRNDLTVYEQAQGFQLMLDLGETEQSIAEKTGFSRATIRHRLNIAKLDQKLLKEKEDSKSFQLTMKDLYELEQVESLEARNKILRLANNSRDLAWRAQRAAADEKRGKKVNQIIPMLETLGVKKAPKKAEDEQYSGNWETVKEISLNKEVPKRIRLPKEKEALYYLPWYDNMRVIKKAEKKTTAVTKEDLERKERDRRKKEIKEKVKAMSTSRKEFIRNIISGRIAAVKKEQDVKDQVWNVLMEARTYISLSSMSYFFSGKSDYECTGEEREAAAEKVKALGCLYQMLLVMDYGMDNAGDIYDWQGHFRSSVGNVLQHGYRILKLYGWSCAEEDWNRIIDGTHELYTSEPGGDEA